MSGARGQKRLLQLLDEARLLIETELAPDDFSNDESISDLHLGIYAGELLNARRRREKFIPADFLGEPAWDILLEAFYRQACAQSTQVKTLLLASGVPPTTALRWIDVLTARDFLVKQQSKTDKRVNRIAMTEHGYNTMRSQLLNMIKNHPSKSAARKIEATM